MREKFVHVKNGKVGQRESGVIVYKYLQEESAQQKERHLLSDMEAQEVVHGRCGVFYVEKND